MYSTNYDAFDFESVSECILSIMKELSYYVVKMSSVNLLRKKRTGRLWFGTGPYCLPVVRFKTYTTDPAKSNITKC